MIHSNPKWAILILIVFTVFSGCFYDNEEDLYPNITCDTSSLSYSQDILPILVSQCYGCHSAAANNGNVNIEGYDNLIPYVQNNRLMGTIQHLDGFSPMPPNANKLSNCNISKLQQWIDDGAPNN